MTLQLSPSDLTFFGPALPESFVQHELEQVLGKALPSAKDAEPAWRSLLKSLHEPMANAGAIRVRNIVLHPLVKGLGYTVTAGAEDVHTREGEESGGLLLKTDGVHLRAWAVGYEDDLDAPTQRGLNYRFSPGRIAERVLLATGERLGLLTNGIELRLILSDPARRSSFVSFSLSQWKQRHYYDPVPDSFRLLLAFAQPAGQKVLPEVLEQARLKQGQVTKDLRAQARQAIESYVESVLDHPANREILASDIEKYGREAVARQLWSEALVMIYRLLFILRGESGGHDTPPFQFASHSLWRNTYSPSNAQAGNLAWVAQKVREEGMQSGEFLETGLRTLFKAFESGVDSSELRIAPLGGALFGPEVTPLLNTLKWGEQGCAALLDNLLRAPRGKGKYRALTRLSYRDLDVEDLGRVYEALLELEPGITSERMVRLRRAKLEVVVPAAQGEKYRPTEHVMTEEADGDELEGEEAVEHEEEEAEEKGTRAGKTKIEWIEEIAPNRFFLRVGLGRKSSGGHYTPESFVRFLVQETLGPLCDKVSPEEDPQPLAILKLKVLDGAMGSGHFLVGADRFMGERLYNACVRCAELGYWDRIPEDIQPYMPGRRPEGESEAGFSAERARALCKRLVAVHCLYGVDKNPLAVGLAKVSLWLESYAEGLPLTFLDHRLICGDSLLGPVNLLGEGPDSPMTPPYATTPIDLALAQGVRERLRERLGVALQKVHELDATVGIDPNDLAAKQQSKRELNDILKPFNDLCTAWSGGIMLGPDKVDESGYRQALELVARGEWPDEEDLNNAINRFETVVETARPTTDREQPRTSLAPGFIAMLKRGREAQGIIYPLAFPEVFSPAGDVEQILGFDAILDNPPWDAIHPAVKEFLASFDIEVLSMPTKRERDTLEKRLTNDPLVGELYEKYLEDFEGQKRANRTLYKHQLIQIEGDLAGRFLDAFRVFAERLAQLLGPHGLIGLVLPSAFHSNEGATGIRQLYLQYLELHFCYSFENKRKLFDIDSRFKFAAILAERTGNETREFKAAFYLKDDMWLFSEDKSPSQLIYTTSFVKQTSPLYLNLLELRSNRDLEVAQTCYSSAESLGRICSNHRLALRTNPAALNMTLDSKRFTPCTKVLSDEQDPRTPDIAQQLLLKGYFALHEGKTFHQFSDTWGERPRYIVGLRNLKDKPEDWLEALRYYRLVSRAIASSTNERTAIMTVLPPGTVVGHSVAIDDSPNAHPNSISFLLMAYSDSHTFDWCLRQLVSANVTLYLLRIAPLPKQLDILPTRTMLAHSALRLVSNHAGYRALWQELLGNKWREPKSSHAWPVLASDSERWDLRAAIDAVVAQGYGLSREQYAHVLSSFSHKSYPKAPDLCLAKLDELNAIGLEPFTRKYDPYWDVPLVETLPKPVIELPSIESLQHKVGEEKSRYDVKNLFGESVTTNLFGEITLPNKPGGGKKKR